MITSKQIINISEKWVQPVKSWHGRSEVFLNPDSTDIKELYNTNNQHIVRFIADNKNKKVYAWDGTTTIHYEVANSIGLGSEYNKLYNSNLLCGTGVIKLGKIQMTDATELELDIYLSKDISSIKSDTKKYLEDLVDNNWSWLTPYVNYFDYFKKIKNFVG